MSAHDNVASGKYENKLPWSVETVPVDEDKMTVSQARAHRESEKQRVRAQHDLHRAEDRRLNQLLKSDLEAEYGLVGHPMADKLWDKAWAHGHSSGYSDVINYYDDFAELLETKAA